MQDADALLLCSQARTAAAADPFSLILHHASVQDTQLACKLLCVNQGLRSSVQQLLQGQLQLIVEPEKDTCSVHGSHHTPATARGIFAGNVCKLTPWIAKHAALLKGLQLDIERVSAPISEEFAAAPAPPGRACCCCCGPCMNCSWGGNEHAGGPYAGQCMDPLQEQAVTAALELAASTGDLVLREFSCSPTSNAILQQLPAATLTSLSLTWFDEDETTHNIPATAAALARLTALKAADFKCSWVECRSFERLSLAGIAAALSGLTSMTSLSLQRIDPWDLQHLPRQLVQLTLVLYRERDLDLHYLTALERLELGSHTANSDDEHAYHWEYQPVLIGDEELPVSLCQLDAADCDDDGVASLLPLHSLQALNIRYCTAGAAALAQLSSLSNLTSLQLGEFPEDTAVALTQLTTLKHLDLGGVSSKNTFGRECTHNPWSAATLKCLGGLTSLSSLSLQTVNAEPQELAAVIAPLAGLTRLLLHLVSGSRLRTQPEYRRPARGAEGDVEQGIAVLVAVLAGLPELHALHINFRQGLTDGQQKQLAYVLPEVRRPVYSGSPVYMGED